MKRKVIKSIKPSKGSKEFLENYLNIKINYDSNVPDIIVMLAKKIQALESKIK